MHDYRHFPAVVFLVSSSLWELPWAPTGFASPQQLPIFPSLCDGHFWYYESILDGTYCEHRLKTLWDGVLSSSKKDLFALHPLPKPFKTRGRGCKFCICIKKWAPGWIQPAFIFHVSPDPWEGVIVPAAAQQAVRVPPTWLLWSWEEVIPTTNPSSAPHGEAGITQGSVTVCRNTGSPWARCCTGIAARGRDVCLKN